MKTLYNTISSRLQTEANLNFIDFDLGQLDVLETGERPAVAFPCALLDISYPNCDDETDTTQMVTALINIRLGIEQQSPTDSLSSEIRRNSGLAVFDTVEEVYKALQGFSDGNFSSFSRRSVKPYRNFKGIKVVDMVFETTFEDLSAE